MSLNNLPRLDDGSFAREFIANGVKYIISKPEDVLTIRRFDVFQKLQITLGFSSSFAELIQKVMEIEKAVNDVAIQKKTYTELALMVHNLRTGLYKRSEKRYDLSMYLCSVFINREDEDVTEWSESLADSKIEDWNKAALKKEDFFLFAMHTSSELMQIYQSYIPAGMQSEA